MFPTDIFLTFLKWQIGKVFHNAYGASISFEKVEFKGGKIVFTGLEVKKNQEMIATFNATYNPKFNLKKREIGGKVKIDNLKVVHKKINKGQFPGIKGPLNRFFSLDLKISILGGELLLYDYLRPSSFFQHFYFDLTQYFSSGDSFGEIVFYKDLYNPKLSSFFFQTHEREVTVTGKFSSDSFPNIYGLMSYSLDPVGSMQGWEFVDGTIDGKLTLNLKEGNPTHLKADVVLSDVQGENAELEIAAQIEKLHALIDTDFATVAGINSEFLVQGGKLSLQDKPNVCVGFWDLNDLHSRISIKKGKLESSVLNANFLGLQGRVILDSDSDDLIHMSFCGLSKEMNSFFPQGFQKGFQKAFPNDFIDLFAKVKKDETSSGLELEGFLRISDEEQKVSHFDFGCHLGHVEKKDDKGVLSLPFSLSRSMANFLDHVKEQFCLTSKRLGWFRARQIALRKFLSPFLFKDINMHIDATVDIDATFDEKYLVLFYEGENLKVESPHFVLQTGQIEKSEDEIAAVHCINLEDFSHVGYLPLNNATYYQKNYGLTFENAHALVQFEDNLIRVKQIETGWKDLRFQGNVDIQINSIEDVRLDISTENFSGPAKNAFSFVSFFVPLKIWNLPLEKGDVEGFFNFKYHFCPKAELQVGKVRGHVKNLTCGQKLFNISADSAEFEYDYAENSLLFNDCQGTLAFPAKNKTYTFSLPKCHLHDFPFFQTAFSLAIQENGKECFNFSCESREIDESREICVCGETCHLTALQTGNTFKVSHFSYGEIEGDALLSICPKSVKIERLFCQKIAEKELLFSGFFDLEKMRLAGQIEKIELDLHETFKKIASFNPKGGLAARGTLDWLLGKNLEVEAQISYKDLELGKIPFGSGGNLKCSYSTLTGLELEGLELEIPIKEELHKCNLGKIFYNFAEKKVQLEGFDFSFSKEKLEAIVKTVEMIFPDKVPPFLLNLLKNAKKEEPLEGKISIEIFPENIWVYLYLKDGTYCFADKKVELKNFSLIYDPQEINLWTRCSYQNNDCWLHFLADSCHLNRGFLEICDREILSDGKRLSDTVVLNWEKKDREGFKIQKVEGGFSGCRVNLKPALSSDLDSLSLKGTVDFEMGKLTPLLWGVIKDFVSDYELNGLYRMEGEIGFHKKTKEFNVSGLITGKEISVSGIQMSDFSTRFGYKKDTLTFENFSLKDLAGQMEIGQIWLYNRKNRWEITVDEAMLTGLRFSKLRCPWLKADQRRKSLRFLIIPSFSLDYLTGTLGDHKSMKGSGRLEFTNLPKKNLFSTLLFLPTEITARIGLDLSNLVPVRGTIVYEIKDSKVNFLELKDTFSDGKRSRFYLAEQTPAWVDFSGNLNLKIKMKQYNLLMKLAEFFTISVKGTLLRPAYTFTNTVDADD